MTDTGSQPTTGPAQEPVQKAAPEDWPPRVPLRTPDGPGGFPPDTPREKGATAKMPRKKPPFLRRMFVGACKLVLVLILISVLWVGLYRFVPVPFTATMASDLLSGRSVTHPWRSLDTMDPDMARAAMGGEDTKFCSHHGFDLEAIGKAWERNQRGGRIRGGSTISQQTAKNVFLWQGGGYFRKGMEAYFTTLIELLWGKRRIMEVYLNVAETGIGTYGAEGGARRYFGHGADQLTAREAAQIAAVLPLPKKRPGRNPGGFTARQANRIEANMRAIRRDGLDTCLR